MEPNMFYEWNGIGPIFFSGIGPKAKADYFQFPLLNKSQVQNVWPTFKEVLLSIILPNIKRLLQFNHFFESFGTLGAGIFLLTIMEQYMLCVCSERKDIDFTIMKNYMSYALKQQAIWHECEILEGQFK